MPQYIRDGELPVNYATGPGYPGANNTYIPVDLSGKLRIGFSRDAKKFHFPKVWQYVESPKGNGYYLKLTSQEAARVVNIQDFQWPDDAPDRTSDSGTESFTFVPFLTSRNSYKFRLGDKTSQQADWPIVEQHGKIKAAQCMTARSVRGWTAATTTSNWAQSGDTANLSADHYSAASSIPGVGGYLDQGTSTSPWLKLALGYIADLVNQDTLGVVDSEPDKYYVIMNPADARKIASSPEIHDYMKSSPAARDEIIKGEHPNGKYGLPSQVYGFNILVENAVRVTNKKGATRASSYVVPNGSIVVASRTGELEGVFGAPSFSTLSMFWYRDEMTVETKHEDWDRLTYGRVVEDTYETVTCPASGFYITSATSS
jgi:hypothetical protein